MGSIESVWRPADLKNLTTIWKKGPARVLPGWRWSLERLTVRYRHAAAQLRSAVQKAALEGNGHSVRAVIRFQFPQNIAHMSFDRLL